MKRQMNHWLRSRTLMILCATGALAAPLSVSAQQQVSASCSVAVDYLYNGVIAEPYRKDFVVAPGVPFVDDFSTPTRIKTFTATAARNSGNLVVSIDYFSDVGVFHSIDFNAQLAIQERGRVESTSGSNGFFASSAVTPQSVSGNHVTNYTLSCRRA